jgi:hypothetical protein
MPCCGGAQLPAPQRGPKMTVKLFLNEKEASAMPDDTKTHDDLVADWKENAERQADLDGGDLQFFQHGLNRLREKVLRKTLFIT